MKKLTLSGIIAASVLMMTACSEDNTLQQQPSAEGNVTFNVTLPAELGSRAFADGYSAKTLQYAVYEASGAANLISEGEATFGDDQLSTTVSLQLANGKAYKIAFFAYNSADVYAFDAENKTVTIDYVQMTAYNSTDYDCFYGTYTTPVVTGPISENVTIYRPVAQINWGTSDLAVYNNAYGDAAANLTTKVDVKGVNNVLNLFDGSRSGEVDITFPALAAPEDETFPVEPAKYAYLSMNYILVPAESSIVEATLTPNNGSADMTAVVVTNMPVQANYRTNVYGALLTSPADFTVTKEENFGGEDNNIEIENPGDGVVKMGNQKFTSIADALTAAKEANMTEVELNLGAGTFPAKEITSDGHTFVSLTIVGQGESTVLDDPATTRTTHDNVILENLKIKTTNENYKGFQHSNSMTYNRCIIENKIFLYGENETFNHCQFINNNDYNVWTYGAKNVTFNACSFGEFGKAVLIYCESQDLTQNITIDNCTFNGTPVNDGKAAIEIDSSLLQNGWYTVNINNAKVSGYDEGSISGNNVWNPKKGTRYTVIVDGVHHIGSTEGLKAALAAATDGMEIMLAEGEFDTKGFTWPQNTTFTISGKGADKTALTNLSDNTNATGCDFTFNDLSLNVEENAYTGTCMGFIHIAKATFNNVTFNGEYHNYATESETYNNCSFVYNAKSDPKQGGRYAVWCYGCRNSIFNECTFDNTFSAKAILVYGDEDSYNRNVTVKNCTFSADNATDKGAVEIHTEKFASSAGTITIENSSCSETFEAGIWNEVNNTTNMSTDFFTIIVDGETVQQGSRQ